MPPSFVIDFTSLLLLGPNATMLVATAGTVTQGLTDSQHSHPAPPNAPERCHRHGCDTGSGLRAPGTRRHDGPLHVAGAGTANRGGGCRVLPRQERLRRTSSCRSVTRQPVNRSWPKSILRGCPNYCIGASLAVGLVEVIDHRNWQVLPVAAVPLYFAYRAYCAHVNRLEEEHRRREVIESLDQGMSVVDSNGRVTLWNDALERILGCPRERALGRSLVGAVPALGKTELPRAIDDALTNSEPPDARAPRAAFCRGCADSAGQNSPRCRRRDAALA